MKLLITSMTLAGALAMAPITAHAGKFRIIVEHEQPIGERAATGSLLLGDMGARGYDGAAHQYFGTPIDEDGKMLVDEAGATSGDGAAVASGAGDMPGRDDTPEPALDLNSVSEVIYNYGDNRRIDVDHIRKKQKANDLPKAPANPGADILAGAPSSASGEQKKALGALLGQFTNPRLDPKHEIKLEPTGETEEVKLNDVLIQIKKKIASRMGGAFGEIWTADLADLEDGQDLMDAIDRIPLAASNRANDTLGVLRQIAKAPNGGLAIRIDTYAPEDDYDEEGAPREILTRAQITSYWDAEIRAVDDSDFQDMVLGVPEIYMAY